MNFKYMVKGKVESGFILRGHYNAVGTDVELMVYDEELEFVKSRCGNVVVENLEKPKVDLPKPMLKEEKNEPKEELTNELQPKQNGGANKGKYKRGV